MGFESKTFLGKSVEFASAIFTCIVAICVGLMVGAAFKNLFFGGLACVVVFYAYAIILKIIYRKPKPHFRAPNPSR